MDYLYNEGIAVVIFGFPAWKLLLASALVCLFYFFSTFVKNFAEKKLHVFSKKTNTNIDDYLYEILSSVSRIFIFIFSLYLGVTLVGVGKNVHEAISNLFLLIFFWQVAKWAILISKILFTKYFRFIIILSFCFGRRQSTTKSKRRICEEIPNS